MILPLLLYTSPIVILVYLAYTHLFLRHVPGPLINSLSNIPRAVSVYHRQPHETQLRLHKQLGALVRLGPTAVSANCEAMVPQIYSIHSKLRKSDFYAVFQNIVNGRRAASLVAMTDEADHARTKRQIAHAYSLSTLVEYESLVSRTIAVFLETLTARFVGDGNTPAGDCDLGRYLQFFAFDVIGELTFSRRLGFVEHGRDVDNIIGAIGANFDYFSVLGQIPWLDGWLGKNPIYIKYFRKPVSSPILRFAQVLLRERLDEIEGGKQVGDGGDGPDRPDFLARFLKVRKDEGGDAMTDSRILSYLFMNINAGSDTIASTLRAIFYHLLKTPSSLSTLLAEFHNAVESGRITPPCPSWTETQSLPYLCAVVKEGLRMNPALSLPLERVVPDGGMLLTDDQGNNTFLPAGTVIGINPWVLHRNPHIFGTDAEAWNPSRWLSAKEKQSKRMEHCLLAFGAGKRSCLGKNIAMLELHKVVPALLLKFEVQLANPLKEWEVKNAWVLNQTGLEVRLTLR